MHTCISSHGLKRSWRSCPRRVNAGNKSTQHAPSTKMECDYLNGWIKKTVTYAKISPQSGEPQRYSWGTQKQTNKQKKQCCDRFMRGEKCVYIMGYFLVGFHEDKVYFFSPQGWHCSYFQHPGMGNLLEFTIFRESSPRFLLRCVGVGGGGEEEEVGLGARKAFWPRLIVLSVFTLL